MTSRSLAPYSLLVLCGICWLAPRGMAQASSPPVDRPDYRTRVEMVDPLRVGIRFQPETGARVRLGRLESVTGAELAPIEMLLGTVDGAWLEPRYRATEERLDDLRRRAEARTRRDAPDLNLFALLRLPPEPSEEANRLRLARLLAALNETPGVAEAWALPIAAPAGKTAPAGGTTPAGGRNGDRTTPDFSALQGYLYAPPSGIWADSAWSFPGGLGEGVKVIDLEWGWLWTHEDLKSPFYVGNEQGPSDHGTAVVGEIVGQHNGYGVNGISPEVAIGGIHLDDIAADVLEAVSVLSPGDLYVMEVQVGGPENWMPVEWWPDVYAAITTGSALGVICLEAAGNGSVDLDNPLYGDSFDRRVRDSGAIMVGAGTPNGLNAEGFSNHGTRVSLQGWGSSVVTTCCGDLQGGAPEVAYTAGFNGTSSATPIVTGAVASLQGQARAAFGTPLTPALAEEILRATGTPQAGTWLIGPRPNLVAARERLLRGYGDVIVTVRDGDTQQPLADVLVEIAETGRRHLTGPAGQVAMQLTAGPLVFHVPASFFYPAADFPFAVTAGMTQEVTLDLFQSPLGTISGHIRDYAGSGLGGARVLLPETPVDTCWTDAAGNFVVTDVPARTYDLLISQVPGFGAVRAPIDVTGDGVTSFDAALPDAETFESGAAGFVATGEWERGTPTFPAQDPVPVFSGQNVWGTNLDGPYGDLVTSVLTSPVYDLSGATSLTLSFHHYYWVDPDDGGQLQVWNAQENRWVVVEPEGGYPDDNIIILYYTGGYNGHLAAYEPAVFHLDAYAGGPFQFRFYFRSTISGHKLGWYVDDVALDLGGGLTLAVDPATLTPDAGPPHIVWSGPNPASTTSKIVFECPAAAVGRLEVFAASGARLRVLNLGVMTGGRQEVSWDGRDALGRPAGSGIFLYRLTAGERVMSGRFVRIR